QHPQAAEKLRFNEALRRIVDTFVTDLAEATRERLARRRVRSVAKVRSLNSRQLGLSARTSKEGKLLKQFLQTHLYSHPIVRSERQRIISHLDRLFMHYMDHAHSLPPFYFEQTQNEPVAVVVCGYIAGMTDNFLEQQYAQVFGKPAA
ncbi:MAG: deoxyguanosinetriphosphate triphosphohydrolase, partial [Terriglobia bacterium]